MLPGDFEDKLIVYLYNHSCFEICLTNASVDSDHRDLYQVSRATLDLLG